MPKRTGSQGYIAAGEVVGEVVQLTGKLSRWRVSPPSLPPTHISSPDLTPSHASTSHLPMRSLSLALTPHCSPRPPRTHLAHPNPNQVSHGRQPGAECVSQARDQAAVEAVEGARQRWGQCGRRVMRGATVTCPALLPPGAATSLSPPPHLPCRLSHAVPAACPLALPTTLPLHHAAYTAGGARVWKRPGWCHGWAHPPPRASSAAHLQTGSQLVDSPPPTPPPLIWLGVGPASSPLSPRSPGQGGVACTRRRGLGCGSLAWAKRRSV